MLGSHAQAAPPLGCSALHSRPWASACASPYTTTACRPTTHQGSHAPSARSAVFRAAAETAAGAQRAQQERGVQPGPRPLREAHDTQGWVVGGWVGGKSIAKNGWWVGGQHVAAKKCCCGLPAWANGTCRLAPRRHVRPQLYATSHSLLAGKVRRLAVDATLRAAAPYQRSRRRRAAASGKAARKIYIDQDDLR